MPAAAAEMLVAGVFALPFNWILFGTENFLFLLYPSPLVATGSEGFLKMGRVMLFMLTKFLVIAAVSAAGGDPGGNRLFRDPECLGGLPCRLAGIALPRPGHSASGCLGVSALRCQRRRRNRAGPQHLDTQYLDSAVPPGLDLGLSEVGFLTGLTAFVD